MNKENLKQSEENNMNKEIKIKWEMLHFLLLMKNKKWYYHS